MDGHGDDHDGEVSDFSDGIPDGVVWRDDSPTLVARSEGGSVEGTGEQDGGEDGSDRSGSVDASEHNKASPPSSEPSKTPPPKMKVTMPFMQAYKAMRGPRDVEPSPLFGCLAKQERRGAGAGEDRENGDEEDDPFVLSGRDEVKLLNDVDDAIVRDCGVDSDLTVIRRSFSEDDDSSGEKRQTVFYFDQPATTPVLSGVTVDGSDTGSGSPITGHVLDREKMDQGWVKANGPHESDNLECYVSDDDGDPGDTYITPAVFRALAAGCALNDVDKLRIPVLADAVASSLRPLTPQDKILQESADTTHRNNVAPHCHSRQFDIHSGEELSPAYRVAPGPASSALWSPPGITPERAGIFLLLMQEGQGTEQQPARGTGMPALFERMAPFELDELRTRLYGDEQKEGADVSGTSVLSAPSCSSSSSDLSTESGASGSGPAAGGSEKRGKLAYTWSEVNEAVRSCLFDPETGAVRPGKAQATARMASGTFSASTPAPAAPIPPERAIIETFHDSWDILRAGQAEDARIVAANEGAQATITAQARCLSRIEHQLAACQAAERARECREAQAHYHQQVHAERRARQRQRRQRRVLRAIDEQLHELRTAAREMEARLAQGRQLQKVLLQRLADGNARLERLCHAHGVTDVAALSALLDEKLAQLDAAALEECF